MTRNLLLIYTLFQGHYKFLPNILSTWNMLRIHSFRWRKHSISGKLLPSSGQTDLSNSIYSNVFHSVCPHYVDKKFKTFSTFFRTS